MELKSNSWKSQYLFSLCSNFLFKSINCYSLSLFFWNNKIFSLFYILYYHINFQQKHFVDLVSADFIERKYRFTSIYNLSSIVYNHRLILNTIIYSSLSMCSITTLFPNSMWYERESWDLFGITYDRNNDLRRILNDYGFKGFPLRKDFPLSGFLEIKYDYIKKSISYEHIRLIQEFRYFDTKVPWRFYH